MTKIHRSGLGWAMVRVRKLGAIQALGAGFRVVFTNLPATLNACGVPMLIIMAGYVLCGQSCYQYAGVEQMPSLPRSEAATWLADALLSYAVIRHVLGRKRMGVVSGLAIFSRTGFVFLLVSGAIALVGLAPFFLSDLLVRANLPWLSLFEKVFLGVVISAVSAMAVFVFVIFLKPMYAAGIRSASLANAIKLSKGYRMVYLRLFAMYMGLSVLLLFAMQYLLIELQLALGKTPMGELLLFLSYRLAVLLLSACFTGSVTFLFKNAATLYLARKRDPYVQISHSYY